MAMKSFVIDAISSAAPDIDELPVTVCLGGQGVSLVVTDEDNVPYLIEQGFFLMEAMPGPMSCGGRLVFIEALGSVPGDIHSTEEDIWCLDDPLPVV